MPVLLRNPLLEAVEEEGEFFKIRHAAVLVIRNTLIIFYSTFVDPDCFQEVIKLAVLSLSDDWNDWGDIQRKGTVFEPRCTWEKGNVRDPYALVFGSTLYLYYIGGGEKGISLAKLPLDDIDALAP